MSDSQIPPELAQIMLRPAIRPVLTSIELSETAGDVVVILTAQTPETVGRFVLPKETAQQLGEQLIAASQSIRGLTSVRKKLEVVRG